jgi:hypothetical protein
MDLGPYLGSPEGSQPGLLDAWSRVSLGWITPTIVRNGNLTLIPGEVPPSNAQVTCCYALEIPIDASSYYLVELRLKQGLDVAQRRSGIIIYLYNASGLAEPQVIDIRRTIPSVGDLFDAALNPGEHFLDVKHQILISIVSGSSAYYSLRIASTVPYSLALSLPSTLNVLTNETFSVSVNPPVPGLSLRILLDGSTNPLRELGTTSAPRYNLSLYLLPSQQGSHNLTARLSDADGNVLASSSMRFMATVPLWVWLEQPSAAYGFVVIGILLAIALSLVFSRNRSRGERLQSRKSTMSPQSTTGEKLMIKWDEVK